MNDLQLLHFVLLALCDPIEKPQTRKELVRMACQYGDFYDVEPKAIERILDKKLIDIIVFYK